jgi:hypothetical protein
MNSLITLLFAALAVVPWATAQLTDEQHEVLLAQAHVRRALTQTI